MTGDEVLVSTDCVCDLPKELREKYQIPIMYYYIRTKEARFQDTKEITSEELIEYIEEDKKTANSKSASIEEYEEFAQKLEEEKLAASEELAEKVQEAAEEQNLDKDIDKFNDDKYVKG